jgi:hypothetical protein
MRGASVKHRRHAGARHGRPIQAIVSASRDASQAPREPVQADRPRERSARSRGGQAQCAAQGTGCQTSGRAPLAGFVERLRDDPTRRFDRPRGHVRLPCHSRERIREGLPHSQQKGRPHREAMDGRPEARSGRGGPRASIEGFGRASKRSLKCNAPRRAFSRHWPSRPGAGAGASATAPIVRRRAGSAPMTDRIARAGRAPRRRRRG